MTYSCVGSPRPLFGGWIYYKKFTAVYFVRFFVAGGGLISYAADFVDQFRLAAGYLDRILKGEKPADMPVQAPTKYETVINLKAAKALGLEIPPTLLARADGMNPKHPPGPAMTVGIV